MEIDLNCDIGESFGEYKLGFDEEIMSFVSSVNIACGFHAGDPMVMDKTIKMAIEKGVSIGAHPGFPDLMGFGRRNMSISPKEARSYVLYQIGALSAFIKAYGGRLNHVKPHGALYNMAAKNYELSYAIAKAIFDFDKDLTFIGLAGSEMIRASKDVGLKYANEVFADRAYQSDGSLVPRTVEGALIKDEEVCVNRVIKMIKEKKIITIEGKEINIVCDTICLHGDNVNALKFAKKINTTFFNEGVNVKSLNK